jgi:ABC-2 type transport system ATP-binding protein
MLKFQKFKKLYGGFPALKIEELTVEPGIYWIKGVNGSGKSTLLKSIAGIPEAGELCRGRTDIP